MDRSREHQTTTLADKFGGCSRIRTYDPLIKSQLLYQLSYAPAPIAPKRGVAKGAEHSGFRSDGKTAARFRF